MCVTDLQTLIQTHTYRSHKMRGKRIWFNFTFPVTSAIIYVMVAQSKDTRHLREKDRKKLGDAASLNFQMN